MDTIHKPRTLAPIRLSLTTHHSDEDTRRTIMCTSRHTDMCGIHMFGCTNGVPTAIYVAARHDVMFNTLVAPICLDDGSISALDHISS